MNTIPEFDPLNPKAGAMHGEAQTLPDEEDEIPSFEGMVFSPYVDLADLTGDNWDSTGGIPDVPVTIWESRPLTEEDVLKVSGSSGQKTEPAEVRRPEIVGIEEAHADWPQATHSFVENLPALGRDTKDKTTPGLYGNLADSTWLTLERLQPVQGAAEAGPPEAAPRGEVAEEIGRIGLAENAETGTRNGDAESVAILQSKIQSDVEATEARVSEADRPVAASVQLLLTGGAAAPEAKWEPQGPPASIFTERPLFQSWYEPEKPPSTMARMPHFGHLAVLIFLAFAGFAGSLMLMRGAISLHMFGVSTVEAAGADIHYTVGFIASFYLITFAAAALVFPRVWDRSLFAGIQWNGAAVLHLRRILILLSAAFVCFLLALLDEVLLPGPTNAPIDKLFDSRTAAWLLFGFGVTFAPFFEEIIFRGFLLPALCTAVDWYGEKMTGKAAPPLEARDHPHWSITAMVLGSIGTSIPFALMHAEQTAWSLGPFLLLVAVSMVLCWARLSTRSVAASVLVHASYNTLLFSLMLLGTGGFRHLDKM